MKLIRKDYTGRTVAEFDSAEEAAEDAIERVDADGQLERVRERCENIAGMFGRLLDEMHGLRNEQIERVLGSDYTVTER